MAPLFLALSTQIQCRVVRRSTNSVETFLSGAPRVINRLSVGKGGLNSFPSMSDVDSDI